MSRVPPAKAALDLDPVRRARGEVVLPGSKSISIRALLLAALARDDTALFGVLESEDTRVMRRALETLGVPLEAGAPGEYTISGSRHFPNQDCDIFVGNSGLSARTLIAALAFMPGCYRFAGVPRMHERPVRDLVDALRGAGATVRYLGLEGFLPLEVRSTGENAKPVIKVRGTASSQFLTGLLQAAPLLAEQHDLRIDVEGDLISRAYVALTLSIMERFGVQVSGDLDSAEPSLSIARGARYSSPGAFHVEGDASSASYLLALGVLGGGPVRVLGVGSKSAQGDIRFANALASMGGLISWGDDWIEASSPGVASGFQLDPIDLDLNHIPDSAMTLAVLALFAKGPSTLRNIGSWRVKETDRISAMANELGKLGARVAAGPDYLQIDPPAHLSRATIDTYDDHRMAMAFSLAAFGGVPIRINDPDCVQKTYPGYFADWAALTGAA